MDPDKRATPTQLLQHSFLKGAFDRKAMKQILTHIFVAERLSQFGF